MNNDIQQDVNRLKVDKIFSLFASFSFVISFSEMEQSRGNNLEKFSDAFFHVKFSAQTEQHGEYLIDSRCNTMNVVAMTTNRNLLFENDMLVFKLQGVKIKFDSKIFWNNLKKLRWIESFPIVPTQESQPQ